MDALVTSELAVTELQLQMPLGSSRRHALSLSRNARSVQTAVQLLHPFLELTHMHAHTHLLRISTLLP